MSTPKLDEERAGLRGAEIEKILRDDSAPQGNARWARFKDRLAIVLVIAVLAFFVFMMIDGSIENYRCRFIQFIMFECNRWDAKWTSG